MGLSSRGQHVTKQTTQRGQPGFRSITTRGEWFADALSLLLGGVDSGSSVGSITVSVGPVTVSLDGIDSASGVGAITVTPGPVDILLNGIDSGSSVGDLTLVQIAPTIYLGGIDSGSDTGAIIVTVGPVNIDLPGIDSNADTGSITLRPVNHVILPGQDSGSSVGSIVVSVGPVTIELAGIDSLSGTGSISVKGINTIVLSGIDSGSGVGAISVQRLTLLTSSRRIPIYRVVIAELNGAELEEVPHKNLSYSFALNNPGGCDFVLPKRHVKVKRSLLEPGQREIHVYRNDALVWGGYLWTVGVSSTDESIRLAGEGYLSRYKRRLVMEEKIYEEEDQLDIAWQLINYSQLRPNGELGITRYSPATSGTLRTLKLRPWEVNVIFDVLEDMAALNDGFDFEITPDKKFRTYYPYQGEDNNIVFDLDKNISSIAYDLDTTNTVSSYTALGAGSGRSRCIVTVDDATALTNFGLLEEAESFEQYKRYANLEERAIEELRLRKAARIQPQIQVVTNDPPFGSFGVGDTCRVRARDGYIEVDQDFKIGTQLVQVSDEGRESNQLFFHEAVSV